ncbi:MAG: DM13 domain-containing protein [Actinobacteria bacterium]|nr:DM13 domain-containing protein [Actinomycetota bacterium]
MSFSISGARAWIAKHPALSSALALAGITLFVLGIVWFEPHKLFLDDRVSEAAPRSAAGASESPVSPGGPSARTVVLSSGAFRPLEHDARGRAVVLRTADGRRFLRFEDLEVSNGPDLVVYLSELGPDQGWRDADDAGFLDLGELKGNMGDQNYEIPADVDLSRFGSVVVWCRRFTVGFAVAPVSVSG